MQRERRQEPMPFDWTLAALGAFMAVVCLPVLGLHGARLVANLVAGAGVTLPAQDQLFTSLWDLARGDAAAGLVPSPEHVAGAGTLWFWSVVVHAVLLALAGWGCAWAWPRFGPGKVLGMATADEAEKALGVSRLRKHRHIIRPDLYPHRGLSGLLVAAASRNRDPVVTYDARLDPEDDRSSW
jgi:hypothetical protein